MDDNKTIEQHPLVKLLNLKEGVDYVPGREVWESAGLWKVLEAAENPPTPEAAAWFKKADQEAWDYWDAHPDLN